MKRKLIATTVFSLAAALLLLWAASCASGPARTADDGLHPAWPAAPDPPRVVHRRNYRGLDDLKRTSGFGRFVEGITGKQRQAMARPSSIAVHAQRHLIVTDQELQGVHIFDLQTGKGRFVSRIDKRTHFVSPVGVAVIGDTFAVADSKLGGVYLFDLDGKRVGQILREGGFKRPTGLAYDAANDQLYVVDTASHRVDVFGRDGSLKRSFGGQGVDVAQFNYPTHVFVDGRGRLFVTDSLNFRLQAFDAQGKYLFDIGKLGDASGYMAVPKGVAADSFGHIYIVDSYFSAVQVFDEQGRFLLSFGHPGEKSGEFRVPGGLCAEGNTLYVADAYNARVQVFEYVGGASDEIATEASK